MDNESVAPSPTHTKSTNIRGHVCPPTSKGWKVETRKENIPLQSHTKGTAAAILLPGYGGDRHGDDGSEPRRAHNAPLMIRDLQSLLQDATMDIKSHVASELNKQLSGLKEELGALANRTNQAEARNTDLTTKTQAHSQDIVYLHSRQVSIEEGLEDLNNRSRHNNIWIRGLPETVATEGLHNTLQDLFKNMLPNPSAQDLTLDWAHRTLCPQALNPATPRDIITCLHFFAVKKLLNTTRTTPPQFQGAWLSFYQYLAPSTLKKWRDLK
ncbi:Hypothetical predicted protein [Pelobates cultripes]|uniref:Uncharacterized protein n=1 Tax=Pelobates cultripes TaxID=61616 RepID=A0AAD1RYV1_PELCU|nr:Hypothetical predicted protein [Pelobates cultripes]